MIKPRIGGHPLHMILAHFPAGLFPMAVVCSTIFYLKGNIIAGHVAFYAMSGGVLMAIAAILFGLWESALVPLSQTKIITNILWHASLNGIVTILFLVWLVKAWKLYPELIKDSMGLVVLKWITMLALITGNYFGGQLVIKYRLGIKEKTTDTK